MIKYIKCFDEVFDKTKSYTIMDGGARVIQVKKIVGTVGKCGELDKNFRYIKRSDISERRRWYRLKGRPRSITFSLPLKYISTRGSTMLLMETGEQQRQKLLAWNL